jgi:hypothetical protein
MAAPVIGNSLAQASHSADGSDMGTAAVLTISLARISCDRSGDVIVDLRARVRRHHLSWRDLERHANA